MSEAAEPVRQVSLTAKGKRWVELIDEGHDPDAALEMVRAEFEADGETRRLPA